MEAKHPPLGHGSAPFLWHLRPPWVDEFSHLHWWPDNATRVPIESVLWEIFPRHPYTWWFLIEGIFEGDREKSPQWSEAEGLLVESLTPYWQTRRRQFFQLLRFSPPFSMRRREKDLDITLSAYGYLSWDELPKKIRSEWKKEVQSLDSQHGFLTWDVTKQAWGIPDVVDLPRTELVELRKAARKHRLSDGKDEAFRKRWEQKGYDDVQNALPNGDLLIAFDPYQPKVELKVAAEAKAMARRWRRLFPKRRKQSHGRLRPGNWLPVIKDFEYEELTRGPHTKRNDQLFARYRRIIGAWRI